MKTAHQHPVTHPERAMKQRSISAHLGATAVAVLAALFAPGLDGWRPAHANATPISTQPIFITPASTDEVKPNILLVLDDSGSMRWAHMPDPAEDFARSSEAGNKRYGFVSNHCNGIYYNPKITYTAPVKADGTSYPDSSFTAAPMDGYVTGSSTVNLSSKFRGWLDTDFTFTGLTRNSDDEGAAYYYTYDKYHASDNPGGKGTVDTEAEKNYNDTNSVFYKECASEIGSTTAVDGTTPVKDLFTRVTVSATSGPGGVDERTNFANWYSYYRNRMMMMKSATSLAFRTLDDQFRVGFMKLNSTNDASFLNVSDFDQTQKDSFYSKLVASTPSGGTPLRRALSNAGRIYSGKISSLPGGATVTDPVQYSCQQNYTILSTDGYWNGSGGLKVDGSTTMGNEDGKLPRPYFDGAQTTRTIVTPYTRTEDRRSTTTVTTTKTWTGVTVSVGGACSFGPPANTVSAYLTVYTSGGNARRTALGVSTTDPDPGNPGRCYRVPPSDNNVWYCRSGSSTSYPVVSQSSVTDKYGRNWTLVSDRGTSVGCVAPGTAWSGYTGAGGICPTVTGSFVTRTLVSQSETITSSTNSLDRYTASQTTTETITNGVSGGVGPLSPATPVYTLTANLDATTTDSDTCGGQPAPCPSASGTWTTGTSFATDVCADPSVIASLTIAPVVTATAGPTTSTSPYTVEASAGPTAGTPTETVTTTGGTSDTLADAAAYYYNTPLRTTDLANCTPGTAKNDLCVGGPTPTADDPATWQHMTTFTLGLGVRGRMVYSNRYPQDAADKVASDYTDVYYGNNATSSVTCTWRDALTTAGAACNWPQAVSDSASAVDDLWHAAVNGHGKYYSATDPNELANGLAQTLKFIVDQPKPGTAASAATTNPKVTENNNYQFSSFFLSVEWSGDLIRQTKDLTTGKPPVFDLMKRDPATFDWSSRDQLDAQTYTTRNIYTKGATGLIAFNWGNLVTDGLDKYFTTPHISTTPPGFPNALTGLSQFCVSGSTCISSTAQAKNTVADGGAAGEALVNFLRGDRSNEEGVSPDTGKFYRRRAHVLGDIVSAQPQYSGAPKWSFADSGYAAYKSANTSRLPLVFAAANDGMLHAFDAGTGAEVWAYIPSFSLPRLYTLADKNYGDKHQYFVEGTPQIGDICPKAPGGTCSSSEWKTIIVGGLNGGGAGYYALDITDPVSPKLLWEFTHNNMGYTFGNPQITKMDDGTWVVALTSGYNNCPKLGTTAQQDCAKDGTGDGGGHLYVLKAGTGALLASISTGEGSVTAPSGLGKIIAHEDATNVTRRIYGGDLSGNVWRFSIGSGGYTAHKLATLKDEDGVAQPIMDKPQVTTINSLPVVYLGTGRYLSTSDVGGAPKQSFYALKDPLNSTYYDNPRTDDDFIEKAAVDGVCPDGTDIAICSPGDKVRTLTTITGETTDSLVNKDGWIVDFPAGAGELAFTDPKLVLGTITFTTSIPSSLSSTDVCRATTNTSEGTSFLYMLDYLNGGVVGSANGVAGTTLGQGIATSPQYSQLQDGSVIITTRMSGGNDVFTKGRFNSQNAAAKRVSWRELVSE
jgi:type IV pilus assembly protein PilY1